MSWDYRVIKHVRQGESWLEIHEAYYEKGEDEPGSWTEESVKPMGETVEELQKDLEYMLQALEKPVLEVSHDGKLRILSQP